MNEKEILITMLKRIGHEIDLSEDTSILKRNMIDDNTCFIRYIFDNNNILINSYILK